MKIKTKINGKTISANYYLDKRSKPQVVEEGTYMTTKEDNIVYPLSIVITAFRKTYIMRSNFFRYHPEYFNNKGYRNFLITEIHFKDNQTNSTLEKCIRKEFQVICKLINFIFEEKGDFNFSNFSNLYEYASSSAELEIEKLNKSTLRGSVELFHLELFHLDMFGQKSFESLGQHIIWEKRFFVLYNTLNAYFDFPQFQDAKKVFDENIKATLNYMKFINYYFNEDFNISIIDFITNGFDIDISNYDAKFKDKLIEESLRMKKSLLAML